ncbi:F-box/WD repeat-containing protein 4 [Copidosoma floridanum]|uniref:F-box/WD repeat-containing protein 4 n=1 Tax=Copidosoma floridanum TaxID=29053 RepID=UPI0006C9BFEC|nr:F-box/WD repeat-containing protein 4 [Copidosoma floridanum]
MTNPSDDSKEQEQPQQQQKGDPSRPTSGQTIKLDKLPLELLLLIFDYCHAFDLVRLSGVCTRFFYIARDDLLWCKRSDHTLATNQVSNRFRSRCNPLLNPRTKWQVTQNWENGRYQKKVLFSQQTKLMPWIQLTGDLLWWSGGNTLCGYLRSDQFNQNNKVYHQEFNSDICKFIVRDDYIISGHRDGSIQFWLMSMMYLENHFYHSINRAHSRDVDAIDETNNIIISGSADGVVKAWTSPKNQGYMSRLPLATVRVGDRVWSLAANPSSTKVAVGTSGTSGPPLNIYDINNFANSTTVDHNWRRGAGILDMVWDDPNTLLTCGYDTCIKKWDLRTGNCVGCWSDPTDATVYSISSDYNYTMVTGTQFNCKAVLWDQRKTNYIQLYFMNLRRLSSPVYSVSFDSCHLYGATDQNVVEVKFTGKPNVDKNYREIIKYER